MQWSVLELCVLDFLGYVLWSFTTITEGAGGRCYDIVIGGGMPHSDHECGEGAWLGGCGLQWSVLELCVLDFLGYVLWSFTTITEGAGGRCHDIVIGGGMPHSDHECGEGAWLGGCGLQWSVLELCVLDFLGYVLWSFTTITEGAGGHCHDIVIGGGRVRG